MLRVLGGKGNDVIEAEFAFPAGSMLDAVLDGGAGRDMVRGRVREVPGGLLPVDTTNEVPVPPMSLLRVHVLGGDSNDELALIVDDIFSSETQLDLLLDGGRSTDRALVTHNVAVQDCEKISCVN